MDTGKFHVTMEDKDGNPVDDKKLSETVVENRDFYEKMKAINKRIKEEYHFDKVY